MDATKQSWKHWLAVVAAGLMMFAGTQTSSGVSIIMAGLRAEYDLAGTITSSILSVKNLAAFIVVFFADKYYGALGLRKGVPLAFGVAALAMGVFHIAGDNVPVLYVAACILGAAYALTMILPMSLLLKTWFNKSRALAMSIASACTGLSTLILSKIVRGNITNYGMDGGYLTEAIVFIAVAAIFFLICRDRPEDMGLEIYGGADYVELKGGRKQTINAAKTNMTYVWLFVLCALMIGIVAAPSQSHLVVTFEAAGYDAALVASAYSIVGLSGMIAKPVFGVLSKTQIKFKWLCTLFLAFRVICCAFTFWSGLNGGTLVSWIPFFACFIFAFGAPVTSVGYNNWVASVSTTEDFPKNVKYAQFAYQGGEIVGALIPGIIFDSVGSYTPWYGIAGVVLVVCILLMLVIYKRVENETAAEAPAQA